jgi:hypothetical protein
LPHKWLHYNAKGGIVYVFDYPKNH